ncbi:hypothetical protein HanIR_Chr12g0589081 [Helianthus annuus]|nr:hypothetical protein HanIR_Chr12g0589081 [Helianthus annuus]
MYINHNGCYYYHYKKKKLHLKNNNNKPFLCYVICKAGYPFHNISKRNFSPQRISCGPYFLKTCYARPSHD